MRIIKKTTVSAVVASGALLLAGLGLPGSGVAQAADGAIDWRITPATPAFHRRRVRATLRPLQHSLAAHRVRVPRAFV